MPTVLLLDVSLSMARVSSSVSGNTHTNTTPTSTSDLHFDQHEHEAEQKKQNGSGSKESSVTKLSLAVQSVYRFLDELGHQAKLEHVALVIFSSLWEVAVPFTRDYDTIKETILDIVLYDKTCLTAAFGAAHDVIQEMWSGASMPCQVVVITDGLVDVTPELFSKLEDSAFPSNYNFHMHCVSGMSEFCCHQNIDKLTKLMESIGGTISVPDGVASVNAVEKLMEKYVHNAYKIYSGSLHCGSLSSTVQLYPPPTSAVKEDDFMNEELQFPHDLSIVGFISQQDIMSPGCISRHMVLALKETSEMGEEDKPEEGKIASMTVLLHGALKVESYVAIVKIRAEWFGMLHSWADSKKKSNLVLSVFKPGVDSVPWLGSFKMLNCLPTHTEPIPGHVVQQLPGLPVPVSDKKSYSSTSSSWLRQATLQADVQKLLRYGRKLPEKLNVFYKELNRIHKAAVSIGFYQLLAGISKILERECTLLPPNAHPDASMQLQHAAGLLSKKEIQSNINIIIRPLDTNFQNK